MKLTLEQSLQKGVAAHNEGRLKEAERCYREVLKTQPDNPYANHNLGVLSAAMGRLSEAMPLFRVAVDADPQIEQHWLSYIRVLIKLKQFEEANRATTHALESGVSSDVVESFYAEVRRASGQSSAAGPSQDQIDIILGHYRAGRLPEAERLANSITENFTEHPFGWAILGAIFQQTGRLDESLAAIEKSVELSPSDPSNHFNRGVVLKELGRLAEAEASYRRAIALKPDYAEAYTNLGNILKERHSLDEAESSYRRAITLRPHYANAHNNLGVTLQALGRLDEAAAALRQATEINPDYFEAHNSLGVTFQEAGRLDEAEASFKKAITLQPDYAEAHSNLAGMLQEAGRLDEAEISYQHALSLKPNLGISRHMLSALAGENTPRAPLDYVENLFDGVAEKFDSTLVGSLNYQIPKYIAELISCRDGPESLGSILDLGCGTGLFGIEIAQRCGRLQGVDLSTNMLRKAEERCIYEKLYKDDIASFLATEFLDFDYFVATDVFIYLGDLTDIFRLIRSRNKSHGNLVFSTEHLEGDGYALRPSGRYGHSKKYIERLCEEFGYELNHFETKNLRLEKDDYLCGGIYLLSF